jgi:hypothetical protein
MPAGVMGASIPGVGIGIRGPTPVLHGAMTPRLAPPPRSSLPPVRGVAASWPPPPPLPVAPYVRTSGATMWHGQRTYLPPHS